MDPTNQRLETGYEPIHVDVWRSDFRLSDGAIYTKFFTDSILALITACPEFNERAIPARVKICLGIVITLLVAPYLPVNTTPIFSAGGVWIILQQLLIGGLC
ncbi:flagellar biosynthetic protein FliR [Symbiopectobacterium purcellii]|uniref:flagellar biosynthetic protein FliR n=1 Tax=Symbiopectobacterium purcellii TaxID=2871826 RepID=UPI003F8638E4